MRNDSVLRKYLIDEIKKAGSRRSRNYLEGLSIEELCEWHKEDTTIRDRYEDSFHKKIGKNKEGKDFTIEDSDLMAVNDPVLESVRKDAAGQSVKLIKKRRSGNMRRKAFKYLSEHSEAPFTLRERMVIRAMPKSNSPKNKAIAKRLGLEVYEFGRIVENIEKKVALYFPGHVKAKPKRQLRVFRTIEVSKDGVTQELVKKNTDPDGYWRAIWRLKQYAPVPKFRSKEKGNLLNRAAQALSKNKKAKVILMRRLKNSDVLNSWGEESALYAEALIALTETNRRCVNSRCNEPIPYLRKSAPLYKYLRQKFKRRDRKYCSVACRQPSKPREVRLNS
ncbi:MAG: hypothetical protein HZB10_00370 [Candidatus Yonathbacteria bacterium]|nr:hypothetical protein [Candidatus Yonathbacteria bacterium]